MKVNVEFRRCARIMAANGQRTLAADSEKAARVDVLALIRLLFVCGTAK